MARLFQNEKGTISEQLYQLIQTHPNGVRESELAGMTQMERRRVNNYLRELEDDNKIYKDGWEWFTT